MSNHNRNNKITKNNNVKRRQITSLAIRSCSPISLQEKVYQIGHVLIISSFISTSGGPCWPRPYLKVGPIPRTCYCSLELLWSRPCVRAGILALLAQSVLIETLVQPHLTPVVGFLLASHMSYAML